jgi:Cu(I)/Ag(I) efflux system membrane fusion protein
MNARSKTIAGLSALVAAGSVGGLGLGYRLGQRSAGETTAASATAVAPPAKGKVLYWYDPMSPEQHFDKPGRSPFMDMPLVPKSAPSGAEATPMAISIDPGITQNLGMRLVKVQRASLPTSIVASATVQFNDRDVAQVQARASGFVQSSSV